MMLIDDVTNFKMHDCTFLSTQQEYKISTNLQGMFICSRYCWFATGKPDHPACKNPTLAIPINPNGKHLGHLAYLIQRAYRKWLTAGNLHQRVAFTK